MEALRNSLNGKIAVVTGAGEGIGRVLANAAAAEGAEVILCARREAKIREVQAEIIAASGKAEVYPIDVTDIDSIVALQQFILDKYGKLDILINSAGVAISKPAWDVNESDWDVMADVGLKSLFFCCQKLGELMRKQQYGKILNMSSTLAVTINKGRSVYCALKAGVTHLTRALAVEWAKDGIRVNALGPTAVRTPSRDESLQGDLLNSLLSRIPLDRLATPEDLVGMAMLLIGPDSDFITGQTIFIDGGWTAV